MSGDCDKNLNHRGHRGSQRNRNLRDAAIKASVALSVLGGSRLSIAEKRN
jgi:hypothetical protein